jgi:hypothetical protein
MVGGLLAFGTTMWNCPYCQQQIALTWKRYFTEPGRKHTCPNCGKISRLSGQTSTKLWALRGLAQLLGGVPLAAVGFSFSLVAGVLGFVVGGFATGFPIDKYVDGKFLQLQKMEDGERS